MRAGACMRNFDKEREQLERKALCARGDSAAWYIQEKSHSSECDPRPHFLIECVVPKDDGELWVSP